MKLTPLPRKASCLIACCACVLALSVGLRAQSPAGMLGTPVPTSASGVPVQGNMFDVENINPANTPPVNICCLGVNCAAPEKSITNWLVWRRILPGSWVPVVTTSNAWVLVGAATNVQSRGPGALTPLPLPINVAIPGGATQAFFVYESTPNGGSGGVVSPPGNMPGGTAGVPPPGVWGPNGPNLRVREGCGRGVNGNRFLGAIIGGPGPGPALTRNFSGNITYGPPVYQIDSNDGRSNVEGREGTSCCKAETTKRDDGMCATGDSLTTLNFESTNLGFPYDLGITAFPAVPLGGGGIATVGGQFVNLDLTDPAFFFLNGGGFTTPFPGNFSVGLAVGAPFDATGQMIIIAPALVDGFALSQPNDFHTIPYATPTNPLPPVGDDSAATFSFEATCGSCTYTFHGASYTEFGVTTNGRVMFGSSSTSFSPSVANAQLAPATIGAWCDLNQALGGVISIGSPVSGIAHVSWVGVPYFGQPATSSTFSVMMDTLSGSFSIGGLNTIAVGAGNQFLGASQGAGASDPGPTPFTSGFHPAPPLATAMIYTFGIEGTLAPGGVTTALFTPGGASFDLTVF